MKNSRPPRPSSLAEERGLLVDQQLRVAVVAHRDRQVHPRAARDQIATNTTGPAGISISVRRSPGVCPELLWNLKPSPRIAERSPATSSSRPVPSSSSVRPGMNEARSRACGDTARSPRLGARDVRRPREREAQGGARLVAGQRAARVIEVEVREHDRVDVLRPHALGGERREQHVLVLDDAVALAQRRLEERADARLEEHGPAASRAPSRQRHASGIRFRSSGAIHRSQSARGALPNIAPPSSRCEFPRIEVSVRTRAS